MTNKRIVIAGGKGFLGSLLTKKLLAHGYEVVILTRRPEPEQFKSDTANSSNIREIAWDGRNLGEWQEELEGAHAVVNLVGRTVNCIYTEENKRQMIESRVHSVETLGAAISKCKNPPKVFVQASSLAIYGDAKERICDEQAPAGNGFPEEICKRWERAFNSLTLPQTRKVLLRIGLVLGPKGGFLAPLTKIVRWFLGGTVGSGKQYISWIHAEDMNEIFLLAIEREKMQGLYNATGQTSVRNKEFMREMRKVLKRPWSPPVPSWAVKLGAHYIMRTEGSLALTGRRCIPKRLQAMGFSFRFNDLPTALADVFKK